MLLIFFVVLLFVFGMVSGRLEKTVVTPTIVFALVGRVNLADVGSLPARKLSAWLRQQAFFQESWSLACLQIREFDCFLSQRRQHKEACFNLKS